VLTFDGLAWWLTFGCRCPLVDIFKLSYHVPRL
jgi:hypothetical protein